MQLEENFLKEYAMLEDSVKMRYIGVGDAEKVQLFYYFVKSETDPQNDPLIIWLTGGPGCSGLSALAVSMGPLNFKKEAYNGSLPKLVYNPYTWTKGTGFSYAKTPQARKSGDLLQAHHAHQFLLKWLIDHPEFISNPFYVGGDSFAGFIAPIVVHEIINGNKHTLPFVNLQCTSRIETDHILMPYCEENKPHRRSLLSILESVHDPEEPSPNIDCPNYMTVLSNYWANDDQVRKALHIREGTIRGNWTRCNLYIDYHPDVESVVPYHMNISSKGYRLLVYSGDHDMSISHIDTEAWIKLLNYSIVDDWRPWFIDDQIAGYTRTYSNRMTYVTIKGGGHTAYFMPKQCDEIFSRWMAGESL